MVDNGRESNGRRAIDKATSLPSITVGFAVLVLGATWVAGARFRDFENTDTAVQRDVQDIGARQRRYIERRDEQHEEFRDELEEIEKKIVELEKLLSARWGEPIG